MADVLLRRDYAGTRHQPYREREIPQIRRGRTITNRCPDSPSNVARRREEDAPHKREDTIEIMMAK